MPDDLEQKTEAELEALMEQMTSGQPAPEPAEPEVEATPTPDPVTNGKTQEAPAAEAAPAVPEPAGEKAPGPQFDHEDFNLQLEELRLSLKEAQLSRDREAGKRGFVEQKLRQLEEQLRSPQAQQPTDELDEPSPQRATAPAQPHQRPKDVSWNIQGALEKAARDFGASKSDLIELKEVHSRHMADQMGELEKFIQESDDPFEVYNQTKSIMEESYIRAKREINTKTQAARAEKRAAQVSNLDELKRKAAGSATGGTAPPPIREKALGDWSEDEADQWLNKLPPP